MSNRAKSRHTSLASRWSSGNMEYKSIPNEPTHFDVEVGRLGLSGHSMGVLASDQRLRRWAAQNRRYYFIPENLLDAWGMKLWDRDMNISGG